MGMGRSGRTCWRSKASGLSYVLALLIFAPAIVATENSYVSRERSVTKIADGVYAIIHKDAVFEGWAQGNTTIIIGEPLLGCAEEWSVI